MKMKLLPIIFLLSAFLTGAVSAQTPAPTQTPYIVYIVVTATPEPSPTPVPAQDDGVQIQRPTPAEPITLVNNGSTETPADNSGEITIVNSSEYAASVDELVQRVVSTVVAETSGAAASLTAGGGKDPAGTGGALVHNADGTTCTMNFRLISEPTYPAGAIIPRGEVFWKEWVIQNTGTCTWTADWEFVFDSGWQIGNTRFHMNRTTEPGQTLNVRLAMVPDQKQDGNYYSTYVFEAPDGTRCGTITSSYTVKPASYFAKPTQTPKDKKRPRNGNCPPWNGWSCPPAPYCPWW